MSTLMTGDYNVGDVISLLWFKRQLPKYATRFIELVVMLYADHGPCVSGQLLPSYQLATVLHQTSQQAIAAQVVSLMGGQLF